MAQCKATGCRNGKVQLLQEIIDCPECGGTGELNKYDVAAQTMNGIPIRDMPIHTGVLDPNNIDYRIEFPLKLDHCTADNSHKIFIVIRDLQHLKSYCKDWIFQVDKRTWERNSEFQITGLAQWMEYSIEFQITGYGDSLELKRFLECKD